MSVASASLPRQSDPDGAVSALALSRVSSNDVRSWRVDQDSAHVRRVEKTCPVLPKASGSLPHGFESGASNPRLLLLVSPTCPLCLAGVDLVMDGVAGPAATSLDVHVVWLPVLEEDDAEAAEIAARSIESRRVMRQYWDDDRSISSAAHTVLDLASRWRRVAWDLYLFYRSGVGWAAPLPVPDVWLHQLDIADQPSLDEQTLAGVLAELLDDRPSRTHESEGAGRLECQSAPSR